MFVPLAIVLVTGYFAVETRPGLSDYRRRKPLRLRSKLEAVGRQFLAAVVDLFPRRPSLCASSPCLDVPDVHDHPSHGHEKWSGGDASVEQIAASVKDAILYQAALSYVLSLVSVALGVALLCFSYKALRGIGSNDLLPPPGG